MSGERVTYIGAGTSRSRKTSGLIKVGQSENPAKRMRSLACELLGTTSLGEGTLREMLRPWLIPHPQLRAHGIETGYVRGGEWYRDCQAVRMLVAWAIEFRPEKKVVGVVLERDE